MSEWHTAGRETLIQQKLNLGRNGKNIWHLSHNLLPSTTSPSSLSQKVCSKQMWPRIQSCFSLPTQSPGIQFTLKETGSQHLICLQSYTTEGCSGQARLAGRRCLPWPSFCSPPAKNLPQMYPTKDANPSLPCLSLLKGFFRGRRRPGRDRVPLWEGNCCPHPQCLCIGKGSALLGMGNVQTLTLFGTKPWQEVIPKVVVENGGARKRGTVLYDVGSNKQKGKPVRNLREPRKTT